MEQINLKEKLKVRNRLPAISETLVIVAQVSKVKPLSNDKYFQQRPKAFYKPISQIF